VADVYKISLLFNLANVSKGMNTFVFDESTGIATDAAILSLSEDWMSAIWLSLRPFMDSGVQLISGVVDELVPSTGDILRHVGTIGPTVNGTVAGDSLPHVDTGSCFARTNVPRVRGGKSFGGFVESTQTDGLFSNPLTAGLAAAVSQWLNGPASAFMRPGVWSSKMSGFVPFVDQGGTTNVPGTRVTRRPGRGM